MARSRKSGRRRKSVSVAPTPFGGDHGTGTAAAVAGTSLQAIKDEKGSNPNNMGQRTRKIIIKDMLSRGTLTMRQFQAAEAIQTAYLSVQRLSSGGPTSERVQSSPKPDMAVTIQVGANSRLVHVMKAVKQMDRGLVEAVCWHNQPLRSAIRGGYVRGYVRFRAALDAAADNIGY